QMVDPWSRALADGLERATRRRTSLPPLDIAFYGDLFLPAGDGSKAMTDPSATLAELSDEELDELMLSVAEMGVDDAGVPDESKGYTRSPGVLQGLLRMLDRRFGPAAGAMCLGELRQVSRYLKSIEIRAGVT